MVASLASCPFQKLTVGRS